MIILDVGHTYIKLMNTNDTNNICRFLLKDISKFYDYIRTSDNVDEIVIGSVNKQLDVELQQFFKTNNYVNVRFLSYLDFKDNIQINSNIKWEEIGIDILASIYYLDDLNYILVNNGTAMVVSYVSDKLEGVMIGCNLTYSFDQMKNITLLENKFMLSYDFAQNTNDSLNSFVTNFIVEPIRKLIDKKQVNKLYLNNIDMKLFLDIDGIQIFAENDLTIKGYLKLLK